MNFAFRQAGEHRFMYDYETLRGALERVGFSQIQRREYDGAIDHPKRAGTGLYVTAAT